MNNKVRLTLNICICMILLLSYSISLKFSGGIFEGRTAIIFSIINVLIGGTICFIMLHGLDLLDSKK